ncbi:hypothetical protein F2S74_10315 [Pseudomonas syringae pv. actinidiae]|nr:hypothetical protein [Pseudomonas syringae pv. actinidiae]
MRPSLSRAAILQILTLIVLIGMLVYQQWQIFHLKAGFECRLARHITWEAVLCCHLDGFVVAEVQHFDRGIVLGVTNERCRFPGTGKCLDQ